MSAFEVVVPAVLAAYPRRASPISSSGALSPFADVVLLLTADSLRAFTGIILPQTPRFWESACIEGADAKTRAHSASLAM